jgi:hypothetical protein
MQVPIDKLAFSFEAMSNPNKDEYLKHADEGVYV